MRIQALFADSSRAARSRRHHPLLLQVAVVVVVKHVNLLPKVV